MDDIDARQRAALRSCARAWRGEWRFAEDAYTPTESALWRAVSRALRPQPEAPAAPRPSPPEPDP
ncbi:MAG: hypothetical protein R3A79_05480 [Nannocystaceae bacterium]